MIKLITAIALTGFVSACAEKNATIPLVFGQATTVGISVGSSATAGGTPEIAVGVKHANLAVVPTVIPKEQALESTKDQKILAWGDAKNKQTSEIDALSTLGSFSNETSGQSVGLGIFFATGVAAQNLSDGFKCKLSNGTHADCSNKPKEEGG